MGQGQDRGRAACCLFLLSRVYSQHLLGPHRTEERIGWRSYPKLCSVARAFPELTDKADCVTVLSVGSHKGEKHLGAAQAHPNFWENAEVKRRQVSSFFLHMAAFCTSVGFFVLWFLCVLLFF